MVGKLHFDSRISGDFRSTGRSQPTDSVKGTQPGDDHCAGEQARQDDETRLTAACSKDAEIAGLSELPKDNSRIGLLSIQGSFS
jgi:hypothetical protein